MEVRMIRRCFPSLFIIPVIAVSSFSGPQIKFDTKAFDCGTVIEGKVDKLDAVFTVTNTGNTTLRLQSVRPGCGCTVVKYDSIIEPGKSAKIESQVKIRGYHAGPITKGITVTSNAENESSTHLDIRAIIRAVAEIAEREIELVPTDAAKGKTLTLTSMKKNIKVTSVSFRPDNPTGAATWENNVPLPIRYTVTPTDSIAADGNAKSLIQLFPPEKVAASAGEFIFKTDDRDKQEIVVRGRIGG
jgi:hypothetical protein